MTWCLGTFGRSIYILDDYTPLRDAHRDLLSRDAAIFPVKDALRYIESSRLGRFLRTRFAGQLRSTRLPTRRLEPCSPTI